MRPRVFRSRVTHDRWLVSYADFITLLFGFFVVLYAFARADQKRQVQVTQAIDTAFHTMGVGGALGAGSSHSHIEAPVKTPSTVVSSAELHAPSQVRDDLDRIRRDLELTLSSQLAQHTVSIQMGADGLVISLREAGFFNSGSAVPRADTVPTLRQIAGPLGRTAYNLRIEGHTDDVPIHNAEFDSNWELSSARATRIAHLFLDLKAMSPERISAAGFAEFHPVASNATAEGRAQNRRVDLIVLPAMRLDLTGAGPTSSNGPWRKISDGE